MGLLKAQRLYLGDAQDPQPCLKVTTLDSAISRNSTTTIKLEKDSDFFHLLLNGLSLAAAVKDSEQRKITNDIEQLEKELAIAVCLRE